MAQSQLDDASLLHFRSQEFEEGMRRMVWITKALECDDSRISQLCRASMTGDNDPCHAIRIKLVDSRFSEFPIWILRIDSDRDVFSDFVVVTSDFRLIVGWSEIEIDTSAVPSGSIKLIESLETYLRKFGVVAT